VSSNGSPRSTARVMMSRTPFLSSGSMIASKLFSRLPISASGSYPVSSRQPPLTNSMVQEPSFRQR